ncbi:hypothetical protein GLOIN_2v1767705 [Rhizophagus irregularis DAOM 181602=DAOM 197198]|nr:hypothetical protein GLOIN_2v1767705 [Rhizophagus irregularis DAOM 181602=DAOM 197198]
MFISADHDKHKIIYPNIRILLYRKVYICYKDTVFQPSDFDMLIAKADELEDEFETLKTLEDIIVQELLRERTEHLIWKNETFETEDLACLRIYCELIPHYLKFNNTATNAKSNRAYSFQVKNVIKQLAKYVILLECLFKTYNFFPDLPSRDNPDHYETFANMLNKSPKNKNSDANTSSESVVGFDAAARVNKTKGKTTGRFHPVPAQNPFNGNANINIEAEFLNWLQEKYREVMVGTNRDALTVMEGRYL